MPCAVFLDGTPFQNRDSFLALVVYNLVTFKRHIVGLLRKSNLCKCGCRGWCSVQPLLDLVRWSFEQLALGRHPSARHDGSAFDPADTERTARAGSSFVVPHCILQIRGDWSEFSNTLAFATWNSTLFPCFLCKSVQSSLYELDKNFDPLHFPFPLLDKADLERATASCEIRVKMTASIHQRLRGALTYDKSKSGGRGRCLKRSFEDLGLRAGDRLEPCSGLRDVGRFEELKEPWPEIVFWRRGMETRVKHRCPLFADELGVDLSHMCVDKLHTMYLGICQDFGGAAMWACINADIYALGQGRSREDMDSLTVLQLRADLMSYYKQRRKQDPTPITEVENLTLPMLGTRRSPTLKLKGLETKGFVGFAVHLLRRFKPSLGARGGQLLAAGEALMELFEVLAANGVVLDTPAVQRLHDVAKKYLRMSELAGVRQKPKAHLFAHMVSRCAVQGNPDAYATMPDESFNGIVAKMARSAHRLVWEARVLEYAEQSAVLQERKRKRA